MTFVVFASILYLIPYVLTFGAFNFFLELRFVNEGFALGFGIEHLNSAEPEKYWIVAFFNWLLVIGILKYIGVV